MLNRDRFGLPVGTNAVCLAKIPGRISGSTEARDDHPAHAATPGNELRRAHQLWSDEYTARGRTAMRSMSNFIYDKRTHRVGMIEFEMMHKRRLPAAVRHADDSAGVFAGLGRVCLATALVAAGALGFSGRTSPEVMIELSKRLVVPRGVARIWWNVRSNFVGAPKIGRV